MKQYISNPFHSGADFHNMEGLFASLSSIEKRGPRIYLDPNFLRQSVEVSAMSYGKGMEELYQYGFVDISYYDNHRLQAVEAAEPGLRPVDYLRRLTNLRLPRGKGPLRTFFAAKKAEKYIICIGIAGTILTLADWNVNMDLGLQEGYHQGYYKNTELLLQTMRQVKFPSIARELGVDALTLWDIVEECRQEDSRFVLWISGHSKGAALMQILVSRLQNELGVKHMIGMGIASARVAGPDFTNVANYPIWNILTKADLVNKLGGAYLLGLNVEFPLGSQYFLYDPKTYVENMEHVEAFWRLFSKITDPSSYLSFVYALNEYLIQRRANGFMDFVKTLHGEERKDLLPKRFLENMRAGYAAFHENIYGKSINMPLAKEFLDGLNLYFDGLSFSKLMQCYLLASNGPHAILRDHLLTPYAHIARALPKHRCYSFVPQKRYLHDKISFAKHSLPRRSMRKKARKLSRNGKPADR